MRKMEFQEYLSLGYLYLLIIGILTDVMQFNYLNINILNYVTFLDILITPIKHLTSNIILPSFLAGYIAFIYLYAKYVQPKLAMTPERKAKLAYSHERFLMLCVLGSLGLFFGLGMGMGAGLKEKLRAGKLVPDHWITFKESKPIKAKIIEQNSMYIFYVPEKEREVIITPISDNIFQIKRITPSNK